MKIDVELIEEMLKKSKSDIYPEDYLGECEVEEGSEEEEFIYENFTSINNYIIKRLETRLAFMKRGLKNEISNHRQSKSFNEYIDNYMYFEGKVLTHENILAFPSSLEQTHIHAVRHMLISEGYNPDEFKVSEIPICGVYYFEKANKPSGTDYFSVFINDQGNIVPQYSTKKYDKDGYNTFPCRSIKEAIEKNEC